jgi:hypothetical protein
MSNGVRLFLRDDSQSTGFQEWPRAFFFSLDFLDKLIVLDVEPLNPVGGRNPRKVAMLENIFMFVQIIDEISIILDKEASPTYTLYGEKSLYPDKVLCRSCRLQAGTSSSPTNSSWLSSELADVLGLLPITWCGVQKD